VSGENFRLFLLEDPDGKDSRDGLHKHKAILNGNPAVEPGYLTMLESSQPCVQPWLCLLKELPGVRGCWRFIARARMDSPQTIFAVWKRSRRRGSAIENAAKPKASAIAAGSARTSPHPAEPHQIR